MCQFDLNFGRRPLSLRPQDVFEACVEKSLMKAPYPASRFRLAFVPGFDAYLPNNFFMNHRSATLFGLSSEILAAFAKIHTPPVYVQITPSPFITDASTE